MEYLNSKTHAWFDFENEESIGQPNWNLRKGKPMYKMYSYEIDEADEGSIGRTPYCRCPDRSQES